MLSVHDNICDEPLPKMCMNTRHKITPGILNLFCAADTFGTVWSLCGKHKFQYTNKV